MLGTSTHSLKGAERMGRDKTTQDDETEQESEDTYYLEGVEVGKSQDNETR
jgi:hypothetical protein